MSNIDLLLYDEIAPNGPSADTLFGGAPSVAGAFAWPTCSTCAGNMRFLGQIRRTATDRLLLVFMCENDSGMCDEWDPNAGGNKVIATPTDGLRLADIPAEDEVERPRHGARVERLAEENYNAARSAWAKEHEGQQRKVLGQLGGTADWLQGDETPACDVCAEPMTLAAQLETGPDYSTEMNFAGGCGYVYDCACEGGTPKFLWQS